MMPELRKLLYVEDDPDIQEVARMALEFTTDLTVETCSSGHEALQKVSSFLPDLILLDVMMPDMDGPTTLEHLRQQEAGAQVPVVFMTAKVQRDETERYLALGAAGIIPKPFDPLTLADDLQAIWRSMHD